MPREEEWNKEGVDTRIDYFLVPEPGISYFFERVDGIWRAGDRKGRPYTFSKDEG